jgi:hypothetical protein
MLLLLVSAAGSYRLMVTILSAAALVAGEGAEEGPPSSGSCNVKAGGNPVYAPVCAAAKTEAACAKLSETCTWVPPRVKPVDTDCMHWVKVTDSGDGTPLYVPARDGGLLVVGWQNGPSWDPGSTERIGTQVICASLYGQLGHFDFDGQGSRPNRCYVKDMSVGNGSQVPPPFYIATFARANLTWSTFNSGDNPPTNAYQLDGDYLGRTLGALQSPSQSAMPGWVAKDGAKLGAMHYEDFGAHDINQFQLATCHPPTRLGYVCSNATNLCVAQNFSGTGSCDLKSGQDPVYKTICTALKTAPACANASETCVWEQQPPPAPDNKTSFPTQQACGAKCIAPPPPPLSKNPCIRFGHAIPVANHVDVEISQAGVAGPNITHTWTDYKFADFSDWVNVFKPGSGTITVWENVGGTRGAQPIYRLEHIPLTPGPLVVVIKVAASQVANESGFWPPARPDSVETIAASYVDTDNSSKIRLFNLAPGTVQAGMSLIPGGTEIASGVAYGLGSSWVKVATAPNAFTFIDDVSKKTLISKTVTPAAAPIGNTVVLLGRQQPSGGGGIQVVSLVDAPEGGTCHP